MPGINPLIGAGVGLGFHALPQVTRQALALPGSVLRNPLPTATTLLGASNALFPQPQQQ